MEERSFPILTKAQGVILDVDGTLVDSNDAHTQAWVDALEKGGYDVPFERVRPLIGMGADNLLPALIGVRKDEPKGMELNDYWQEIFTAEYLPHIRAFPGTRELVERLRDEGITVVVASSAEQSLLQSLLKIARVDDLIEATTGSGEAKRSKPDPDSIDIALEKTGLPARLVRMVGDSPFDVEAATKAGVGTIALRCGGFSDADLHDALAIYNDPADLLAHLDGSPIAHLPQG